MKRFVYDLPTRVFHWSFVALFLSSILIAKFVDSDSGVFCYHMLSGLLMILVIAIRIIWGLIGTKYARFSGFDLRPVSLAHYLIGIVKSDRRRWPGHNPATSFAALAMMLTGLSLGITGLLMTYGRQKERFEDIHELLSTAFIVLVVSHLLGLVIHTIRHKEMIATSMIDGRKKDIAPADSIPTPRNALGLLFLATIVASAIYLLAHYSSTTRSLKLFGQTIPLAEAESD